MEITVLAYQQDAHKKYLWVKDKALASYTTDDIEILIATMDREDLSFLERIFSLPLSQISQPILIVNQSKTRQLSSDVDSIRVINDANHGLSRSRNIAVENASRKYVWILDDDVVILPDALEKIVHAINTDAEYFLLSFQAVLPKGGLMRPYKPKSFDYSKKTMKNGTVSFEMVLNVNRFNSSGVRFDERFGLGSTFPLCEEQILIYDSLMAGERSKYVPREIVVHKAESSGTDATLTPVLYARGAMAKHMNKNTIVFKWKYGFFLFRKGLVTNIKTLYQSVQWIQKGVDDYSKI